MNAAPYVTLILSNRWTELNNDEEDAVMKQRNDELMKDVAEL